MRRAAARCLVTAIAAAGILAAVAPAALQAAGHPVAAWLGRLAMSPVCHQDPGRSFALWGAPAAVCARCLGTYAGFLAAALLAGLVPARWSVVLATGPRTAGAPAGGAGDPRLRPRLILAAGIAPAALQWLLARLVPGAAWLDANSPRAVTGFILGAAVGAVVLAAVNQMAASPFLPRRGPRPPRAKETLHAPAA